MPLPDLPDYDWLFVVLVAQGCDQGLEGPRVTQPTQGPCRIDPFGNGPSVGVCGANADTIAARHLIRMIAAGAAAHSDHGRDVAHTLLMIAEDPNSDYTVKDEGKLKALAAHYGIETKGREIKEIAGDMAKAANFTLSKVKGAAFISIACSIAIASVVKVSYP